MNHSYSLTTSSKRCVMTMRKSFTQKRSCDVSGGIDPGLSTNRSSPKFVNRVFVIGETTEKQKMNSLFQTEMGRNNNTLIVTFYLAQLDRLEAAMKAKRTRQKITLCFTMTTQDSVSNGVLFSQSMMKTGTCLNTCLILPLKLQLINTSIGR